MIELMVVIAIIGILAGVVTVSMKSSIDKSKRASALTSAASVLPELVTCQDDGGFVKTTPVAGEVICWAQAGYTSAAEGHSNVLWPNIATKTGWSYDAGTTGSWAAGTYTFRITDGTSYVVCSMLLNGCE